jgi:glycosyltransferase involved in cell wall biosynthesis
VSKQQALRIIHTEASLGWGGQEIRILTEMLAMRERGHVMGLAAQPQSEILTRSRKAGIAAFEFFANRLSYPAAIAKLSAFFHSSRPDVVNMHSSRDGYLAGIAARLAGVPFIVRSRHIDVDYPHPLISMLAFRYIPHKTLCTSARIASRLRNELRLPEERLAVSSTGIDPKQFDFRKKGTLRKELGLAPETPIVSIVSVIRSWKGHSIFIKACARVAREIPDARFLIAGDGPGARKLPGSIEFMGLEGKTVLLGHRDDVENILASSNVLTLPSTAHEGVPQIVLQAQFMKTPVVASAVGGVPEVVNHGTTGLLVPPGDDEALAAAIVRALKDAALSNYLSETAYKQAIRDHTLEAMCAGLERIYDRGLSKTP